MSERTAAPKVVLTSSLSVLVALAVLGAPPAEATEGPPPASSDVSRPETEDPRLADNANGSRVWVGGFLDRFVHFRRRGPHLNVNLTPSRQTLEPMNPMKDIKLPGSDAPPPNADEGQLSIIAMPNIKFNPSEGLGLGIAIPVIWSEPGIRPYKYSFVLQLVTSTKLVQDHVLIYDIVDLLGLPIRISGAVGFYAFTDEPFCGVGSTATCDPSVPARLASQRNLTGQAELDLIDQYYIMRILRPYNWTVLRFRLFEFFGQWSLFTGLRSEWYIPGFFGDVLAGEVLRSGPYEGSAFEQVSPTGQPGVVNVAQVGMMVDTRDFEPSPREGYWIETSLRGASTWALSSWNFAGANAIVRFYTPLLPSRNLTLATRIIGDVIVGDAPVQELARIGGSQDIRGFGGRWVGRGFRQQRYIGHAKLAYQNELRWDAIRFDLDGLSLGFEFTTFLDVGVVVAEGVDYAFDRGLIRPIPVYVNGGVGLRYVINKNIVIRMDLGFSREEGFIPQLYIDGAHIF